MNVWVQSAFYQRELHRQPSAPAVLVRHRHHLSTSLETSGTKTIFKFYNFNAIALFASPEREIISLSDSLVGATRRRHHAPKKQLHRSTTSTNFILIRLIHRQS